MNEEEARDLAYEDAEPEEEEAPTTIRPPFDPEQFARESDSRIAFQEEPPSSRPTAPPPPGSPHYELEWSPGAIDVFPPVSSEAVPSLAIARQDLEWFELPGLARDLLGEVDGRSTLAVVCTRGGFALEAATAACQELERQGIVTLRRGSSIGG